MSFEHPIIPAFDLSKKQQKKLQALMALQEEGENEAGIELTETPTEKSLTRKSYLKLRGVTYARALHTSGSRVASLDEGSWIPWITSGPVHLRNRTDPFETFLSQLKATCLGNSSKASPGYDVAATGSPLAATCSVPMIGAVVTVGYIGDTARRVGIALAVAWTINGVTVTDNVAVLPTAKEGANHHIAQFVILAATNNAGEGSVALATAVTVTLLEAAEAWVNAAVTMTVEPINLRDLEA